jgi:hypothetical protein
MRRFVYLFRWGERYKIGMSEKPQRRLGEVTDGSDAEIVHLIPSTYPGQVERALHRRFAAVCVRSEWFALSAADVAAICRLGRTDKADDLPDDLRPLFAACTHAEASARRQITFQASPGLYSDLQHTAEELGLNMTSLVCMILAENIGPYRKRARSLAGAVLPHREDD